MRPWVQKPKRKVMIASNPPKSPNKTPNAYPPQKNPKETTKFFHFISFHFSISFHSIFPFPSPSHRIWLNLIGLLQKSWQPRHPSLWTLLCKTLRTFNLILWVELLRWSYGVTIKWPAGWLSNDLRGDYRMNVVTPIVTPSCQTHESPRGVGWVFFPLPNFLSAVSIMNDDELA